jgi:hypothetical protein
LNSVILTKRPLAASEAYTQNSQDRFNDVKPVNSVSGLVYTDQAGTLKLQESQDNSAWTDTRIITVAAGVVNKIEWTQLTKRWYRFLYTNGATAQTSFVLLQEISEHDIIDVGKMSKGTVVTVHNAITATVTSAEQSAEGFNSILVEVDISVAVKLWTFKLQGSMVSGGTFRDWYEQANTGTMTLMSYQTNASKGWVWKGIPNYYKIVATEDEDGATVSVRCQPFNS